MAWIDSRYLDQQRKLEREVLQLRREWDELKLEITARRTAAQREVKAARIAFEKLCHNLQLSAEQKAGFNPDQPRDDHGKWTDGGRSGDAGKDGDDRARSTDISAQRRGGGRRTPQEARRDQAAERAQQAVRRVRELDPNWQPRTVSFIKPQSIEGAIRHSEALTREAEARFVELSHAGLDRNWPRHDPAPLGEVLLAPGGELVGVRDIGAGTKIRTVTSAEFENIRSELMVGARQIGIDQRYDGVRYQRQDSIFGLRLSRGHGLTLDVIESNHPAIPPGTRIHQR
ncbi:MAG: filamentous hemagglutinin [Hyphomicrobiales bacterium]|jgi:hypothetical protein|nr:filamentous hemagglutinin [Hyphomicrobiales bacterium]